MGVTIFTRTSVHWAERIVATSNSHALRCFNAQVACGITICDPSPAMILRTRSGLSGSYPDFLLGEGAFGLIEDASLAAAALLVARLLRAV